MRFLCLGCSVQVEPGLSVQEVVDLRITRIQETGLILGLSMAWWESLEDSQ